MSEVPKQPSVTAVMVTGKSRERLMFARVAVDRFLAQDYPAADLLIVNDGADSVLEAPCDRVRELHVTGARNASGERLTLGELRNLGIEWATGQYIIQWDDDDWYAAERISTQVAALGKSGIVCLRRWTIADLWSHEVGVHDARGRRPWHAIEGTVLFPRSTPCRYHAARRGEGSYFLADLARQHGRPAVVKNDPLLYVHTYHGGNTWDRGHIMRQITRPMAPEEYEAFRVPFPAFPPSPLTPRTA